MSNFSNIPISHYKALKLPLNPEPNSVYYILDKDSNIVKGYITTLKGEAIPLFTSSGGTGTGTVESVTGTGVTGTETNPVVDIATFVSSQLGNLVHLSIVDGKLAVNKITSPDSSITITNTPTEIQLQLSQDIQTIIDGKEDVSNKQNNLDFDGTGEKYPTVDTVNEAFLRNTRLFARTGISNKNDGFELTIVNPNTIGINQVDSAIFWDELFAPNAVVGDAIKTFPQISYPLTELVTATGGNINTVPIVADGIYVRYLGYDINGNVVSSPDSFIENSSVVQLGFTTVLKTGATVTFLGGTAPNARNVFSQPILANLNDLDRITVTSTTDITVNYNTGTPSLNSDAGIITGIAINWRGVNNPTNSEPIDKFNYLGDNEVDFVSLTPNSLTQSTPFVMHTLWTELDEGVQINESFFNTTSQSRDTLDNGAFGIKRVLIGIRGGIFVQESEFATSAGYATIDAARANIFTHEFTDAIIPSGLVIEIARIIFKKSVTDFSDEDEFIIVSTVGGASSGGSIASVGDATTVTKGIIKLAGDFDPTSTADVPVIISATETQAGKVELATDAETLAGIDTTKAVHPFGLKGALDLKANDNNVLHRTGNEPFTGIKSSIISAINTPAFDISNPVAGATSTGFQLTNSNTGRGIYINNISTGQGVYLDNGSSGSGIYSVNLSGGNGLRADNTASGTGMLINNNLIGLGLKINNATGATGKPFQYTKNNVERAFLNDAGQFQAVNFITTGGTASQVVLGNGNLGTYSTASGTVNFIPKFTSVNILGNSQIKDDGNNIQIKNTETFPNSAYDISLGWTSNKTFSIEDSDNTAAGANLTVKAGRTINFTKSSSFIQTAISGSNILFTINKSDNSIYSISGSNITKSVEGSNIFNIVGAVSGAISDISVDYLNNDVWVITLPATNGNPPRIYKQTGGIGSFVLQSFTGLPNISTGGGTVSLAINSVTKDMFFVSGTDVGGDGFIYKKLSASSNFTLYNNSITCTTYTKVKVNESNNDVLLYTGSSTSQFLYKQSAGSGAFSQIFTTGSSAGLVPLMFSFDVSNITNDIYTVSGGELANNMRVYKQSSGIGSFVLQNVVVGTGLSYNYQFQTSISIDNKGDVYTCVNNGATYKQTNFAIGTPDLNGGTLLLKAGTGKNLGQSRVQIITGTKTISSGTDMQIEQVVAEFDENRNATFFGNIIKSGGTFSQYLMADGSVREDNQFPQITIVTSSSIDTTTTVSGLSQKGRNVVISNGASAINYTVNSSDGFVASYVKHGTGSITFVAGSGRTLTQVDGTAILNGALGSTATISSVGTVDYLRISNA